MPEFSWVERHAFEFRQTDSKPNTCFVLLHGFAGSPAEMRPLGEALFAKGYDAVGPALLGHGINPAALNLVRWQDWVEAARDFLHEERERYPTVVLVGLSMGALVSSIIVSSSEPPELPDALVLLAPALKARDERLKWARWMKYVLPWFPETVRPQAGLTSKDGWKRLWHYEKRPVHALAELYYIQEYAKTILNKVHKPVLVVHGMKDLTVPESSARDVYEGLASRQKEILWLEKSGHCLTADVELDLLVSEIIEFLGRALPSIEK